MHSPARPFARLLACLLLSAAVPALADTHSGCEGFSWEVGHELALLAAPPVAADGNPRQSGSAPLLQLDRHYTLALAPQAEVAFAAHPGKPMLDDGARAGLFAFRVPADGVYRIAITSGHWIDVVDAGQALPTLDFQGRRGCPLVHKIVAFELRAGHDLLLQFSGGTVDPVGVTITAAPAPVR